MHVHQLQDLSSEIHEMSSLFTGRCAYVDIWLQSIICGQFVVMQISTYELGCRPSMIHILMTISFMQHMLVKMLPTWVCQKWKNNERIYFNMHFEELPKLIIVVTENYLQYVDIQFSMNYELPKYHIFMKRINIFIKEINHSFDKLWSCTLWNHNSSPVVCIWISRMLVVIYFNFAFSGADMWQFWTDLCTSGRKHETLS